MTDTDNLTLARRYIAALSAGADAEQLSEFLAPDFIQEEFPNRLQPTGVTRDLTAVMAARTSGRQLLADEQFEIVNAIASGSQVALEIVWTGTVSAATGPFQTGQHLRARFATFLEFQDGRIARQRNYDCFDPW